jgi:uncharacterized membrane protein
VFWPLAIPYRSPFWLDETVSYWEISGGLRQIWSRTVDGMSFPLYFYILWTVKKLVGSQEVVLRLPSLLAMLAAVYVRYRIAREYFDRDIAACILFCVQKDVAYAAIDARPYAFAVLATNLAILTFIRWVRPPTKWNSVGLGIQSRL